MAIDIGMCKLWETEDFVSYKFFTNVPSEEYINKRGRKAIRHRTAYGYCLFNKSTGEFELVGQTDPYFMERSQTPEIVYGRLVRFLMENEPFPEITGIAS